MEKDKSLVDLLVNEISFGQGGLGQEDFALLAYKGKITREDIPSLRESVRERIENLRSQNVYRLPSPEKVQKMLDKFVSDNLVEEGELISKLGNSFDGVSSMGYGVYGIFSITYEDLGDITYVDKEGKGLVGGVFQVWSGEHNSDVCIDPIDKSFIFGISSRFENGRYEHEALVRLDLVTKECKKWPVSQEIVDSCLSAIREEGKQFEVFQAACSFADGEEKITGDEALVRACKEFGIEPEISKGIRI